MAKTKRKAKRGIRTQGLILPAEGQSLKELWRAFEQGGTWHRLGRRLARRARFRHAAYSGLLRIERWGQAIRFVIEDGDGSGKLTGAFLGHAARHGVGLVERIDIRFP